MFMYPRSHDGQILVVSSTDGYCTLVTFSPDELGVTYVKPVVVEASTSTAEEKREVVLQPAVRKVVVPCDKQSPLTNSPQSPLVIY